MTQFHLKPNLLWTPNPDQPKVTAEICLEQEKICVCFDVLENPKFFRQKCQKDGDPCWQDSCVEVFLKTQNGYFNFELNSIGCCLAEFGVARTPRRRFEPNEYAQIIRDIRQLPQTMPDGQIHWSLEVKIPRKIRIFPPNTSLHPSNDSSSDSSAHNHPIIAAPNLDIHLPQTVIEIPHPISGNLYKCASCAEIPNYLSAFPIETPTPDFHRPEYFRPLIPNMR